MVWVVVGGCVYLADGARCAVSAAHDEIDGLPVGTPRMPSQPCVEYCTAHTWQVPAVDPQPAIRVVLCLLVTLQPYLKVAQ